METLTHNPEAEKEKLLEEIFKRPTVIGIEGGPCSGKTTFVESLEKLQTERPIVVLPEAATQVANKYLKSGIDIMSLIQHDHDAMMRFEAKVVKLTIKQIEEAKQKYNGTDAIIVADRVDIGAYVQPQEYRQILDNLHREATPLVECVDKILYFPTLARKDPAKFMQIRRSDDPICKETPEQAVALCEANLKCASQHPEFHYMDTGDFGHTLEVATQYVLNPESEYEKGGYLLGELEEAENLIRTKEKEGQLLVDTTVIQRYSQCNGLNYRLRSELLGEVSSDYQNPTPVRFSVSIKDKASNSELQRVISKKEYDDLFERDDDMVDKFRCRFLHKDPSSGSINVWSLDDIHVGAKHFGWTFEVESHSQESLKDLEPPFQFYAEKTHSNRDLPKIAFKLSMLESMLPPKKMNPNDFNDDDIPSLMFY